LALLALKQKGFQYEFENGSIAVRQVKDGITRDAFDGDKKVTFESLIDGIMQPFIAKSAGGGNDGGDTVDTGKTKIIQLDGKEDLHSLMQKSASYVSIP
jgi:hypothetical protein